MFPFATRQVGSGSDAKAAGEANGEEHLTARLGKANMVPSLEVVTTSEACVRV